MSGPPLLELALRYRDECGECGGVGVTIENMDCEDCREIREVIAQATEWIRFHLDGVTGLERDGRSPGNGAESRNAFRDPPSDLT